MMKLLSTIGIALWLAVGAMSAQDVCCGNKSPALPLVNLTGELYNPARPPDTSTYYNRLWLPSDIQLMNGEVVRNVYLRYSKLSDEVFWFEPRNRKTIRLDKEPIIRFHFRNIEGDTSVYFCKLTIKPVLSVDSITIFAEEVYHGRLSFFVRRGCEPDRQDLVTQAGSTYMITHYRDLPGYYIRSGNGRTFTITGLRKKDLYVLAPKNRESIRKFCHQNRSLVTGKKEDLKALARFLETLGI
jgi:hypothetical protein